MIAVPLPEIGAERWLDGIRFVATRQKSNAPAQHAVIWDGGAVGGKFTQYEETSSSDPRRVFRFNGFWHDDWEFMARATKASAELRYEREKQFVETYEAQLGTIERGEAR